MIATLCRKWDAIAISDEIYEHIIYDGHRHIPIATLEGMADRTITLNGLSKTFSVTGWRVGWTAGPAAVIKAMGNVQSQQTGCPCSVSQYAALAALEGDQECVEKMRREFEARQALRLIRELHLTQRGTVGGPDPIMEYWLADGQAPQGLVSGLRTVPLDPAGLRCSLDAFEAADAPTERLHPVDDVAIGGAS